MNMTVQKSFADKRNTGIDLLRVISMLMIVAVHLLTHGGLLFAFPPFSSSYEAAQLLAAFTFCAVNCYALITGFVMSQTSFKLSRLLALWSEVLFWSVGLSAVMALAFPEQVSWHDVLLGLFPVTQNRYWYFTAYFGLSFFIPALNCLLRQMPARTLLLTGVAAVCLFSLLPVFSSTDLFGLQHGFHILWLAVLYLIGGSLRKYGMPSASKSNKWLLVYTLCAFIAWAGRLTVELLQARGKVHRISPEFLYRYVSPTMLLAAVALVLFFAGLKLRPWAVRCIAATAPLTFGVYLIHDHPHIREHFIHHWLLHSFGLPPLQLSLVVVGSVAVIFVLCLLLEALRQRLFAILKINLLLERLARKIHAWIDQIVPF